MKIAYFDCFSGISGDMVLGALIDHGVDADWLKTMIRSHVTDEAELCVTNTFRKGIRAVHVQVEVGQSRSRDYAAIRDLISGSGLPEKVIAQSLSIFKKIAEAESRIHGCDMDHVHFHELGGVDALVDIVGAVLCMDALGFTHVRASRLPLGSGFVTCEHGTLPVPAPATAEILKGVPVRQSDIPFELVTPTGAAIITVMADGFGPMPDMTMDRISYGAGSRDLENTPNLLRVISGETAAPEQTALMVETAIDDMNPEIFGYVMERLFDLGVLDVCLMPVYMKKNRPGTLLQVLCRPHQRDAVIALILAETTTLGVRYYPVERQVLARESVEIDTPFGRVAAKKIHMPDNTTRIVPEYEACRQIALREKLPIRMIYERITGHADPGKE
jgi:pyridinium-3,5-bisthiocarboxylic acid mononucleotide nickel chelatase